MINDKQTEYWRDTLETAESEAYNAGKKDTPEENIATRKNREKKERNERKVNGLVMGKLNEDMLFLDKLANHPSLQNNLLKYEIKKNEKNEIENSLTEIKGAALDGLTFLQMRRNFWEASLPPKTEKKKDKTKRRSRSNNRKTSTYKN